MSSNAFSKEFIEAQRKRLEALKADLMAADDASLEETDAIQRERGAEAREYEDAAQGLDRREVLQSKHEVDLQRLARIERALKKIDLGTYGFSDVSGKQIPKARLEATPEAVSTVDEAEARA